MTTLMWPEHLDEVDKGGCSTVLNILYKLKDSLALLHKPDPYSEFKQLAYREQLEFLKKGFEITDKMFKVMEKREKHEKLAKQASGM